MLWRKTVENTPNNPPEQQDPTIAQPSAKVEWTNMTTQTSPYENPYTSQPQGAYQPPPAVAQSAVNATPYNRLATALFVLLILSLFTAPLLFIPILIFAAIASRRLVSDTASARKSTNIVIRIFTILGWIALTVVIIFAAFIAFVIISLGSGDAKCG
jgi:hypothetical protein